MPTIADVARLLDEFAPCRLAEDWDNVGLLVGDRARAASSIMTCLTLSEDVADEAIAAGADLVVTHHPLPFRPLKRLTTDTPEGRTLWKLIGAGISIYSPHTGLDSAANGINAQLATALELKETKPLVELEPAVLDQCVAKAALGAGRCGWLAKPLTLDELAASVCQMLAIDHVRVVGDAEQSIARVAVACGSGGSFLDAAITAGVGALLTGEATFHTLLSARAAGVAMVLTGHYASERFALEALADYLSGQLPDCNVWASRDEVDPLRLFAV